jgi:hypothetical protein
MYFGSNLTATLQSAGEPRVSKKLSFAAEEDKGWSRLAKSVQGLEWTLGGSIRHTFSRVPTKSTSDKEKPKKQANSVNKPRQRSRERGDSKAKKSGKSGKTGTAGKSNKTRNRMEVRGAFVVKCKGFDVSGPVGDSEAGIALKLSPASEIALKTKFMSKTGKAGSCLGAKYTLNRCVSVRATLDQDYLVGGVLEYANKKSTTFKNMKLVGKQATSGDHVVGLHCEFGGTE